MRYENTIHYPANRGAVTAMLRDESFFKLRWQPIDPQAQIDVAETEREITVTSLVKPTVDALPAATSLLKTGIAIRCVEVWNKDESGLVVGMTLTMVASGVPVKVTSKGRLHQVEQGLDLKMSGDVECTIPLVGRAIESSLIDHLDSVDKSEEAAARQYLG